MQALRRDTDAGAIAANAQRWSIFLGGLEKDDGNYPLWEWTLVQVGL